MRQNRLSLVVFCFMFANLAHSEPPEKIGQHIGKAHRNIGKAAIHPLSTDFFKNLDNDERVPDRPIGPPEAGDQSALAPKNDENQPNEQAPLREEAPE